MYFDCHHEYIVDDYLNGTRVCTSCGLVCCNLLIDETPEYRSFQHDKIHYAKDVYENQANTCKLQLIVKELKNQCERMNIDTVTQNEAITLFQKYYELGNCKKTLMYACIYLSCKANFYHQKKFSCLVNDFQVKKLVNKIQDIECQNQYTAHEQLENIKYDKYNLNEKYENHEKNDKYGKDDNKEKNYKYGKDDNNKKNDNIEKKYSTKNNNLAEKKKFNNVSFMYEKSDFVSKYFDYFQQFKFFLKKLLEEKNLIKNSNQNKSLYNTTLDKLIDNLLLMHNTIKFSNRSTDVCFGALLLKSARDELNDSELEKQIEKYLANLFNISQVNLKITENMI